MGPPPKTAARPFTFDRVFDGDVVIEPQRPRKSYTAEELAQARAEGFAEGERSALAQAEQALARAVAEVAAACGEALGALETTVHGCRAEVGRLALAAAGKMAGAALERFPDAAAAAVLDSLAGELTPAPKLLVRAAPDSLPRLGPALEAAAAQAGFAGRLILRGDASLPSAAFVFDWGEGRCEFDPEAAAARVAAALERALEAEAPRAPADPSQTEVR